MNNFKLMIVVGTRPEIIRLSQVIKCAFDRFQVVLVHTGQNYDKNLSNIFFEDLELPKPDYYLDCNTSSAISLIADSLIKVEDVIKRELPDAFLVLGDTNSCLTSIVPKKFKIPIFHMEAGNRCFDARVPEETNRKIVDVIADINLTYSDISREYLLNEGFPAKQIIKTGSPMLEVINKYLNKANASNILEKLSITKNEYILVSTHREENVDSKDRIKIILDTILKISNTYDKKVIVSLHPRTKKSLEKSKLKLPKKIKLCEPFSFTDYLNLQLNSFVTISDSGTINEEASILGFPAINLRDTHERPEAMEESATILTGLSEDRVLQALKMITESNFKPRIPLDYNIDNVSEKVCRIILSYTDYINRYVWYK